ncbi:MAG: hypothetical protein Q7S22_02925 [Candidatus Micrarchaeota archaeon]|nr:hypothetical protein [Candidatus Micrarchaeota archaeon]
MKLLHVLFICFLASVIFADTGPGPASPEIKIKLFDNSKPYTGEATANYLCSLATERGPPKGAVEPGDVQLECANGECSDAGWYYKFNPCFYSEGKFEITTNGKTVITPKVSLENPGTYSFDVDVGTGKIAGEEFKSSCLGAILLAIPFLAVITKK